MLAFIYGNFVGEKITKSSNELLRSTAFNNFIASPSEKKITNTLNFINVNVKQIENQCIDSTIMLVYCVEQAIVSLVYILSINGIAAMVFLVCGLIPSVIPRLTRNWVQTGTKSGIAVMKTIIKKQVMLCMVLILSDMQMVIIDSKYLSKKH